MMAAKNNATCCGKNVFPGRGRCPQRPGLNVAAVVSRLASSVAATATLIPVTCRVAANGSKAYICRAGRWGQRPLPLNCADRSAEFLAKKNHEHGYMRGDAAPRAYRRLESYEALVFL